jgi:emp24/gp25L/p24 family/GOLD
LISSLDLSFGRNDKNYANVILTVNVIPLNRIFDTELHHAPVREHLKATVHTLEANEGYILHTFEMNGIANVCVQSKSASQRFPVAIGLRIETSDEIPSLVVENKRALESPADVDAHLTHMEMELKRITASMTQLLNEADLNRDQDERFHQLTMEMVKATTFWPIVQVCVLLMTGFTQASHIVQFFKRRRII